MEILQIGPRPVILVKNKVYKFFKSNQECQNEIKRLSNSPLSELVDEISLYKMKFVKVSEISENYYVMEKVNGASLNLKNKINNFYLAGRWLSCFHGITSNNKNKEVFLYGDFISSHLFVDNNLREVSAIDPGTSFGLIGEIEIDISRFIVSLLQTKSLNIIKLNKIIVNFINGYGLKIISFNKLDKLIKLRIIKNYEKTKKLKSGLKVNFIAYLFLIFSKIKYQLIKQNLKKMSK